MQVPAESRGMGCAGWELAPERCSPKPRVRCWPRLCVWVLPPAPSVVAPVSSARWWLAARGSRTQGEEAPRLITPDRGGLAGLFLTVLIEAGFLLALTLPHHYRLPGSQPPG